MIKHPNPTYTLAKLYENQDQLLDAIQIYLQLIDKNDQPELQERFEALKDKYYQKKKDDFADLTKKIFSGNDRKKFNIISHKEYQNFLESHKEPHEFETYPEEMVQNENSKEIKTSKENNIKTEADLTVSEKENADSEREKASLQEEKEITDDHFTDIVKNEDNEKFDSEKDFDEDKKEEASSDKKSEFESKNINPVDDILNLYSREKDDNLEDEFKELFVETEKSEPDEKQENNDRPTLTEEQSAQLSSDGKVESVDESEEIKNHYKASSRKLLEELKEIDVVKLNEILFENLGSKKSLNDVKLSDLNFALQLLKTTENNDED